MKRIKKYVLLSLGFIFLSLAILGIFLPLLPTTPFLLLSVSCFYKCSRRFHSWLINHKIFGKIIKNYREGKKVDPKIKWFTLIILWATIGFSMYLFHNNIFILIFLFVIVVIVSLHISGCRLLSRNKGS